MLAAPAARRIDEIMRRLRIAAQRAQHPRQWPIEAEHVDQFPGRHTQSKPTIPVVRVKEQCPDVALPNSRTQTHGRSLTGTAVPCQMQSSRGSTGQWGIGVGVRVASGGWVHTLPISTHGPQKSGLGVGSVAYVGVGGSGVGVGAAIVWIATAAPFRLARTSGFSHGEGVLGKEAEALLGGEVETGVLDDDGFQNETKTISATMPSVITTRLSEIAVWKMGDCFTHDSELGAYHNPPAPS